VLLPPAAPIALLEDDANDVFFVRTALQRAGIDNPLTVFSATQEARDHFARDAREPLLLPTLFIVDVHLNGPESGIDFLRWLRTRSRPLRETPVMMLSGSQDPAHHQETSLLDAVLFLQKPVRPQTLVEAVQALGYVVVTRKDSRVHRYIERRATEGPR
jgi:DNA-binding response OmpR family regulator